MKSCTPSLKASRLRVSDRSKVGPRSHPHPAFSLPKQVVAACLMGESIMADKKLPQDHPLANILINVIIPVLILSYLSKDPVLQEKLGKIAKPWHIGPLKAMILALALPLGYGAWHYLKTRTG